MRKKEQGEKLQGQIDNLNKEQDRKMKEISDNCDKKIKEAQDRADQQIRDAQNQGNLSEKLLELIEKNRADAEERSRKDKEIIENRAKADMKEKEDGLRREMALQKEID